MKYLSVCSGIEAATMAWHSLGWHPFAFSEIEAFPAAVLAHHYSDTPNLGDMTKFQEWPDAAIDVLVGGTPCQSFSVAGLRKGLADPRGNLMLIYLAIADRYRPEWLVWENVPGVLSSNGGRDFGTFLGGLGELGYGFAYRVLDAQYVRVESHACAVPQRRRRVFVVGNSRSWRRAAAVLFERESLCGHPAPSREAGQRPAPTISARTKGGGGLGTDFDCDGGLIHDTVGALCADTHPGGYSGQDAYTGRLVAHSLRADGFDASEDGTGRGTPLVPVGVTIHGTDKTASVASYTDVAGALRARTPGGQENSSTTAVLGFSRKDHGVDASEVAPTLRSMGHDDSHANGGGQIAVAFAHQAGGKQTTLGYSDDGTVQTLGANQTPAVMTLAIRGRGDSHELEIREDGTANALLTPNGGRGGIGCGAVAFAQNQRDEVRQMDVAGALASEPGMKQQTYLRQAMQVRRLTPRECERLQGFPDDFTLIPVGKKMAADGPRYKALGNSMAVNVMRWIGERIAIVDAIPDVQERAA